MHAEHVIYNTLYTEKHLLLYHGVLWGLKTFSHFTFYFHWLLGAILRVDSFPLYRDDQTSGNSVNLYCSIPEAEQSAESRAFRRLCSVALPRKQRSKPLPSRLALGGCTRPPPSPLPHSALPTFHGLHHGGRLQTPVSGPSTSPKASLKQHIFYHPTGVQTSTEILGCAIQLTEATWVPVRTEGACDRKCKNWEVTEPICEHSFTSYQVDSVLTEMYSTVSCSETRCKEVGSAAIYKCLTGGHLCCKINGDSKRLETGIYGMNSESLTQMELTFTC